MCVVGFGLDNYSGRSLNDWVLLNWQRTDGELFVVADVGNWRKVLEANWWRRGRDMVGVLVAAIVWSQR